MRRFRKRTRRVRRYYVKPVARITIYPLISALIASVLFVLGRTLRVSFITERHDHDAIRDQKQIVYAFWHGRQFLMFRIARGIGCTVLVSPSDGGDIQAGVLRLFGNLPVRGSSTRGAVGGLVNVIRNVRAGRHAAFAVDGPRGPIHEAKPGALEVARKTGAVVVPVSISYGRHLVLRSTWDKYHFPVPFSRTRVAIGEPISVAATLSQKELYRQCRSLGEELNRLTRLVDPVEG